VGSKSITLTGETLAALRDSLVAQGVPVQEGRTTYEWFRVSTRGYECVAYHSGKLSYSNSEKLLSMLDALPSNQKPVEFDYLGGTDEAGKGEWFGPLVVAIALLTPSQFQSCNRLGVKDSKLLKTGKIIDLADRMRSLEVIHEVFVLSPEKYNRLYQEFTQEGKNLNDLLAWAHTKLIKDKSTKLPTHRVRVLVDLFDRTKTSLRLGNLTTAWIVEQAPHAEADTAVAAASIFARERFLREVQRLERAFKIVLFGVDPRNLPTSVLPKVAKIHFSNIKGLLKEK